MEEKTQSIREMYNNMVRSFSRVCLESQKERSEKTDYSNY